jgi:hypothetical protein
MFQARTFFMLSFLTLTLLVSADAKAFDQLGCETLSECFTRCCPSNNPTCEQTCRNSCNTSPVSCPAFYYHCPYNTFVADYNWLELLNLSNASLAGTFQYLSGAGATLTSEVAFELNSFSRRDFDIHSVVGTSAIGQVIVGLNGESDPLRVSVSYYEIAASGVTHTVTLECVKRARETS